MCKFQFYYRTYASILLTMGLLLLASSCKVPVIVGPPDHTIIPPTFGPGVDSTKHILSSWRGFFKDENLVHLIDTALQNNQELSIRLQEIEIARNDVRLRKAAMLPSVGARIGAGLEKVGRYTSQGAGDASTDIVPGKEFPDPLGDLSVSAYANWEVDLWAKLRQAKKAAFSRYLASVEGKNLICTQLIAEVASAYYELIALDSQLGIVRENIVLQSQALEIVKAQKEAAKTTELAVQKFNAEVLTAKSLEFKILQQTRETENKINLLLGRYPRPIPRDGHQLLSLLPQEIQAGVPSQLLENRPDVKQAELTLTAAKLDLKIARAEFFPHLDISASAGLNAFKPGYLFRLPESLLYNIAGDLAGPLINRNALKAEFSTANAKQLQAMYNYERTVLNAFLEVSNQLSNLENLEKSYALKSAQVAALDRSIGIASDLFKSARADYFEVLMTQRDALEAKLELIENRKAQMIAAVSVYRDLGGGWK